MAASFQRAVFWARIPSGKPVWCAIPRLAPGAFIGTIPRLAPGAFMGACAARIPLGKPCGLEGLEGPIFSVAHTVLTGR